MITVAISKDPLQGKILRLNPCWRHQVVTGSSASACLSLRFLIIGWPVNLDCFLGNSSNLFLIINSTFSWYYCREWLPPIHYEMSSNQSLHRKSLRYPLKRRNSTPTAWLWWYWCHRCRRLDHGWRMSRNSSQRGSHLWLWKWPIRRVWGYCLCAHRALPIGIRVW